MAVKTISTKAMLVSIERTFKPSQKTWMNDAVHFIGEAIQGIGCYLPMEKKSTLVTIENRRGRIPCDAESIVYIEYNGNRLPMSLDGRTFDLKNIMPVGGGYGINAGYIFAPFSEGAIRVHYVAIAKDKEGFPLILDSFPYKEAVKYWVIAQMMHGGYTSSIISFDKAMQYWEEYREDAQTETNMPANVDELQNFANMWTRTYDNDGTLADRFGTGNEYPEMMEGGSLGLPAYEDKNIFTPSDETE